MLEEFDLFRLLKETIHDIKRAFMQAKVTLPLTKLFKS